MGKRDDFGAALGEHPADRGGEPAALRRRVEFGHCGALRREARREDPPVPVAGDDMPAIARQFVGEVLRIADAEDLRRRVVPETPGRKRDRGEQRFQVARRQVDYEAVIPPSRSALNFAMVVSMCQLIASGSVGSARGNAAARS
jgi:hypothetical protein